jgi:hypothetical protein
MRMLLPVMLHLSRAEPQRPLVLLVLQLALLVLQLVLLQTLLLVEPRLLRLVALLTCPVARRRASESQKLFAAASSGPLGVAATRSSICWLASWARRSTTRLAGWVSSSARL